MLDICDFTLYIIRGIYVYLERPAHIYAIIRNSWQINGWIKTLWKHDQVTYDPKWTENYILGPMIKF